MNLENGLLKKNKLLNRSKKVIFIRNDEFKSSKEINFLSSNQYEVILDEALLEKWINKLKRTSIFAFNIQTDNINDIFSDLVGLAFSTDPKSAIYIPIAHHYSNVPRQILIKRVLTAFKPVFEDGNILKIGQNLKHNCSILKKYGIELRGIAFDIILESYILNKISTHRKINYINEYWLKYIGSSISRKDNDIKRKLRFSEIPIEKAGYFASRYVDVTLRLHHKMWSKLQKNEGSLNAFKRIEMPLVPVLSRIERNGVKINSDALFKYSKELQCRLDELEQKAREISGELFDLSSTKQVREILLKKENIKPLKKTPSGIFSISEESLRKLAISCPLSRVILEYRKLMKLKSNYIDKLPTMVNSNTGRIHTSYHQSITITGRLSSSDPNLQNIPARSKEGRRIRQAFIAPENYSIVSVDYSQIELRIMAYLSQDRNLIKRLSEGKDIHLITASEIFHLPIENVTEELRQNAKIINFGLIYGMSAFGLSHHLNLSYKESRKYMNLYFENYPGVLDYIEYSQEKARKQGYVETLNGRRIYLPNIKSKNSLRRISAERSAINAPIQGTATDIIKRAMISIDAWIERDRPRAKMIMQIHDELVFEVHKEELKMVSKKIKKLMEENVELDIPLPVRVGIGDDWNLAH